MATTTCGHAYDHYTVDEQRLCYTCWLALHNAKRATVRANLARLLAGGVTLFESKEMVSPWNTDWSIDTFTGQWRTFHHGSGGTGSFAPPKDSTTNPLPAEMSARDAGAVLLAAHLENRHSAFGTTLEAYCMTCGDELLPLPEDGDPCCPACAKKLAHFEEVHNRSPTVLKLPAKYRHQAALDAQTAGLRRIYEDRRRREREREQMRFIMEWLIVAALVTAGLIYLGTRSVTTPPPAAIPAAADLFDTIQ